jgi:hypothetical protein
MLPSLSLQTPLLHIVLLRRNCSAEELSVMTMFDRLLAANLLLCGGNINSPHKQGVITSCLPTLESSDEWHLYRCLFLTRLMPYNFL